MPTVPTSLKAIVYDAPTNGNGGNLFFITVSGHRFPIDDDFPCDEGLDGRVQQLVPASSDFNDPFPNMVRYSHRDSTHAAAVVWGLKFRSHMHGSGKHEGGYHPGKNKRRNLPTSAVDERLSDLERASRLLGFPVVTLVATREVVARMEEQRSYEVFASPRAVSGGNGHHNGYKA
ncbi:hypothetical protein HYU20_01800 [Candidatus Woesearchaeota archaeon]|nr:hypothetical protein [Candidatus Woesearchaeota archaeon]